MKALTMTAALTLGASAALAGNTEPPRMEPEVIVAQAAQSSTGAQAFVLLSAAVVFATAVASGN